MVYGTAVRVASFYIAGKQPKHFSDHESLTSLKEVAERPTRKPFILGESACGQ